MSETLPGFLKEQASRAFRYLLREAEGLAPEEARRGARPDWPSHKWGVGQDGSMAGIVYHVAAWKTLTLPLFLPGGAALTVEQFDAGAAPEPGDWPAVLDWLWRVGNEWEAALNALPDAAFAETRDWEGATLRVSQFVSEMLQHDIQHAAQLEYLKQLYAVERI